MAKFFPKKEETHLRNDNTNTSRVYNPYHDLQDASNLQPFRTLYNLPTSPEFLFPEDALKNRRSMSDNLTKNTGLAYVTGALGGGITGTVSGLRAVEKGESLKLVINRILNSGGSAGRKFGNRLGIMGLMFAGLEGTIYNCRREVDDAWNYVAAGLATGAIYRAAAGPRSAALAGGLGALLAGAVVVGKNVSKRYVPI